MVWFSVEAGTLLGRVDNVVGLGPLVTTVAAWAVHYFSSRWRCSRDVRTLNIYETPPVAGHVHVRLATHTAQPDAEHHHGFIDFHDQYCAIHSLSGPLPPAVSVSLVETAGCQCLQRS